MPGVMGHASWAILVVRSCVARVPDVPAGCQSDQVC